MIRIANNQLISLRRRRWVGVKTSLCDYSNKLVKNASKDDNDNGRLAFSTAAYNFETTINLLNSSNLNKFMLSQGIIFTNTTRSFSSSVKDGNDGSYYDLNNNLPTFEESLATLSGKPIEESSGSDSMEMADAIASTTPTFEAAWYSPTDQAVNLVQFVHEATGLEYATSIFALTIAIRMALFPLMVISQKNMSRMAHMKPEMDIISAKMAKMPKDASIEERSKATRQYQALMAKYDCNPMKSIGVMLAQTPIFVGMFFGLQKMPGYFPEIATGGLWWFTDLTVADPYYILPCITAATFVAGVEVNKQLTLASNPTQGPMMINAMRGLGLIMIPLTAHFPSIVFCYWVANNSFTFCQMMAFKQPMVRKYLDIWEAPKPVPGQANKKMTDIYNEWSEGREKEKQENEKKKKIVEHNKRVDQSQRRSRRWKN